MRAGVPGSGPPMPPAAAGLPAVSRENGRLQEPNRLLYRCSRLPALVRRSELQETCMNDQNTPAPGFQFGLANLKPAEPVQKVTLTFPDGAKRDYPRGTSGLDIAKGISPSLAKRTVAMALDGTVADLNDP